MFNIFIALPAASACLAAFKDGAAYRLLQDRQSRHFIDALSNAKALVVASLSLSFGSQRDGDDAIDTLKKAAQLQFSGHHASKNFSYLWMILVFQLVKEIGGLGVWLVVEQSRGALDGNLSPEQFRHHVLVWVLLEVGTRQV